MKILLAMDDSEYSQAALQTILTNHRPQDTEVLVLHVITPVASFVPPMMAEGYASEWDRVRKEQLQLAQQLVGRAKEKLCTAGFKTDSIVSEGNVRAEIVERAAEWHSDLIVMGSQGLKGLNRLLLGSVSEFVARHAPCSVEIVRLSVAKAA